MDATDALGAPLKPARRRGGRPRSSGTGSRSRKLECSSRCGYIARSTIGACKRHGYPSCGCGAPLIFVELDDLIAAGDPDALEAAERAEGAELERRARAEIRSAEREASSGFKTGAANCAVCGRFKTRPADVCGFCGDEPATYGPDERHEREVHNRGAGYRL